MAEPVAFPHLSPLVESVYDLFSNYKAQLPLHVCDCELCVTPDIQREIVNTPLRSLSFALLQSWEESAGARALEPHYDGTPATRAWQDEVKAFLPRLFECAALGEAPSVLGIESAFRTIGIADWQSWPTKESDAVISFVEAFFQQRLGHLAFGIAPVGQVLASDTGGEEVAEALIKMGLPVNRVIDLWRDAPDPAAVVHLADARRSLKWDLATGKRLQGTIWLDDVKAQAELGEWQASDEVAARIEAAFFAIEGDDHDAKAMREILSRGLG